MSSNFLENLSSLIAIVSSGYASYKVITTDFFNREQKYKEKIVVPFMNEYQKNHNISSIKFCKKRTKFTEEYIPTYVPYLIDTNEEEKLKKILITDYFGMRTNDENILSKMFIVFQKCGIYITNVVAFAGFAIAPYMMVQAVGKQISWKNLILGIVLMILVYVFVLLVVFSSRMLHNYSYSSKTQDIQNVIKKKEKRYEEKIKEKYYFKK